MARFITMALSGLLVFASLSQAQYSRSVGSSSSGRLENSRYVPEASRNAEPAAPLPEAALRPTMNEAAYFRDDFKPMAFIERVFVDVLGREPSEQESRYWLLRMRDMSRRDIAQAIRERRPLYWQGHYDPRYGAIRYPDPAALYFPDPGGAFFKSPYFPNYEYARPLRAFPTRARG